MHPAPACLRCGDFDIAPEAALATVPLCRACLLRPAADPPRVGGWAYSLEGLPRGGIFLAFVLSVGLVLSPRSPSLAALAGAAVLLLGMALVFALAWRRLRAATVRALGFSEALLAAAPGIEARFVLHLRVESPEAAAVALETALLLLGPGGALLYGVAPRSRAAVAPAPEGIDPPFAYPAWRRGWVALGERGLLVSATPLPTPRAAARLAADLERRLNPSPSPRR